MKAKKYITKELYIDIQGITLLSAEEYRACHKYIGPSGYAWWLRSTGYHSIFAAFVMFDGRMNCYGDYTDAELCVRPALKIKSSNLSTGDKFALFDYDWTVISNEYVLCNNSIGRHCFRKNLDVDKPSDYETSDVKKFIESWFREKVADNE